jgi:glycine oxidase
VIAGLRPATPDNRPLIGAADDDGVIYATGHYRNGILLAPVTADALVERLVTGVTPALIEPFSPLRFAA